MRPAGGAMKKCEHIRRVLFAAALPACNAGKSFLCPLLWFMLNTVQAFSQPPGHVVINELMASNTVTYADQDGSYEDWIELYNPTAGAIDLAGYYLTDNLSNLKKSRLVSGSQSLVVPAGGFLILWPSDKHDSYNNHISWGLSAEGESIALVAPDGVTILDSFTFPAQRPDVSMGRRHETSDEWVWFSAPTPLGSNGASQGYQGALAPPLFSHAGGFYPTPFGLTLSAPEGTAIMYTLDGSEPAAENIGGKTFTYKQSYPLEPGSSPGELLTDLMNTYPYTGPISIQDRSGEANRFSAMSSTFDPSPAAYVPPGEAVKKGVVVKAKAVREGYLASVSETHTYFGFDNHYAIPVFSLTTSGENLFGYDNGIYNAGVTFDQWRQQNPSLTANGITPANYHRSGVEWEHPVSVELFLPVTNQRVTATNAGFRGQGRYTRASPHKSLRLYFRTRYGGSSLNHAIFPDSEASQFSRIVLRNWGNDRNDQFALFRDPVVRRIVRRLKAETQESQPVVTYINGEYWGIADAKTRFDAKYFERKYGIPEDDLELLERDAMINEGTSNTHYLNMRDFVRDNAMGVAGNYAYVRTLMDVENFVDYQLAQIYFGNSDWPTNNVRYYRKKTAAYEPDAPLNHDGRWRWLHYDLDFTMGNHAAEQYLNSLKRAIEHPSPWASVLLTKLLDNADFKRSFIVRYADLMNVVFNAEQANESIAYYENSIRPEMNAYRARWPYGRTSGWDWETHLRLMKDYADQRQGYARAHLKEQFSLGNEQQLNVTVTNAEDKAYVQVNTLHLKPGEPGIDAPVTAWSGLYYPDYPVMLTTHTERGKRFVRWEGDVSSSEDTIRITLTAAMNIQAIFEDDRSDEAGLLHYWHFNGVSDYANSITADFTHNGITPGIVVYAGKDGTVSAGEAGNMDGVGTGSTLNLVGDAPSGSALRPRNPSNEKELIFTLPSRGYGDLKLAYATHRTNNGAQTQRLFYTTNYIAATAQGRLTATEWQALGGPVAVATGFDLVAVDLPADVYGADNFAVKIQFEGSNAVLDEGNNRFDNITFRGVYQGSLPVRLIDFEVSREAESAVLRWHTVAEINFLRFEIEHSTTGTTWSKSGEVAAQNGTGSNAYRYTVGLQKGRNYYRLKMIDHDGTYAYSEIRSVRMDGAPAPGVQIYPNPVSGRFYLNSSEPVAEVVLWDLAGRLLRREAYGKDTGVSVAGLGPGVVVAEIRYTNGTISKGKIVVGN